MVKKLKYLIFFVPFLFTLNVNAMLLGTPNSFAHFNDDTITGPSNATIVGYWGSNNYYKSPYLMGGVSAGSYVKQIDFNWNNANLCPNDDISISGSVAGLYNMFTEQSTSFLAYNNSSAMACTTSIQQSGSRLDFSCYGKGGGTLSMYVLMNSFSLVKQYEIGVTRDMTVTCDASNLDVIQNATNNTNSIINNNNQNTNTIVDNSNQNTQDIINNQNENTDKTNELLGSCSKNIFNVFDYTYSSARYTKTDIPEQYAVVLTANANHTGGSFPLIYHLKLKPSTTYYFKHGSSVAETGRLMYYIYRGSPNGTLFHYTDDSNDFSFTTPATNYVDYYFQIYVTGTQTSGGRVVIQRPMLFEGTNYTGSYLAYNEEKCTSKLDDNTNAINGLNDSITSESTPNTNQDISDMNDMVASDTPITDLLTLPMTLINAYYNGINASCSPYNFGSLLGTDIIFPCINLENRLGHNLWMIIDSLCSIFIIYSIAMLFVHAFDSLTSLKDDFDDMYVPRHAGKHVGGGFNG